VIRFNCPHCSRFYELPNALSHLPLLCKSCGNTLEAPAPSPDPEPQKIWEPPDAVSEAASGKEPGVRSVEKAVPATATPLPPVEPEFAAGPSRLDTWARQKALPAIIDAAAGLLLLVVGVLLGEVLARRSTRDVLWEAGYAAKFPPLDLLLWMAPPLLACLGFALLVSRGKSPGQWYRRKKKDAAERM
jgi:hypothetical protein